MILLVLIAALLLEQHHPISSRKYLHGCLSYYVNLFRDHFNAGQHEHGMIAWLLVVLPLLTSVVVLHWLLHFVHPILAWALDLLVLYITMGFRQFSRYFTDIQLALREGRLAEAGELLSHWRGIPAQDLKAEEISRIAIEQALIASHRSVFGVIVWFVLFSLVGLGGAGGALLYRLGHYLYTSFEVQEAVEPTGQLDGEWSEGSYGRFAQQAISFLEWLPVRLTAMTFAIVGNFENTIHCWRTQASGWPVHETGILLSSGAGALGVRLGMPIPQSGVPLYRPDLGTGDDASPDIMQSTVGLVWRSLVFWLILLFLLTLVSLQG